MNVRQPHLRVVRLPEDPGAPVDFDTLFRRYASYVAGVAARLLGRDDHEVEDVVHSSGSAQTRTSRHKRRTRSVPNGRLDV